MFCQAQDRPEQTDELLLRRLTDDRATEGKRLEQRAVTFSA
jgi:hypothetical protein